MKLVSWVLNYSKNLIESSLVMIFNVHLFEKLPTQDRWASGTQAAVDLS